MHTDNAQLTVSSVHTSDLRRRGIQLQGLLQLQSVLGYTPQYTRCTETSGYTLSINFFIEHTYIHASTYVICILHLYCTTYVMSLLTHRMYSTYLCTTSLFTNNMHHTYVQHNYLHTTCTVHVYNITIHMHRTCVQHHYSHAPYIRTTSLFTHHMHSTYVQHTIHKQHAPYMHTMSLFTHYAQGKYMSEVSDIDIRT